MARATRCLSCVAPSAPQYKTYLRSNTPALLGERKYTGLYRCSVTENGLVRNILGYRELRNCRSTASKANLPGGGRAPAVCGASARRLQRGLRALQLPSQPKRRLATHQISCCSPSRQAELFWTFSTFGAANADFSQPWCLKLTKVRPQSQLSRTFERKVIKSHEKSSESDQKS